MSANKGTKKPDALLLRVMREIHKTAETPEKGFRTIEGWGKHWGLGRSRTREYILKALELGLMEERPFRISTRATSMPYPIAHYREKRRRAK